jgi:hypothetical protein
MDMVGLGNNLNELKIRIQKIHHELNSLGEPNLPLEQMIGTTNLLRQNEYLVESDAKKTELIAIYAEYAKQLEQIVTSLFSIQTDLKELIKSEASLIESEKPKKITRKTKKA